MASLLCLNPLPLYHGGGDFFTLSLPLRSDGRQQEASFREGISYAR
jgi:hypothetical protein